MSGRFGSLRSSSSNSRNSSRSNNSRNSSCSCNARGGGGSRNFNADGSLAQSNASGTSPFGTNSQFANGSSSFSRGWNF